MDGKLHLWQLEMEESEQLVEALAGGALAYGCLKPHCLPGAAAGVTVVSVLGHGLGTAAGSQWVIWQTSYGAK